MIIRRETLAAILPATQKTDHTHRCDQIQITPAGEVIATDGHILLVARENTRFPDEDFPKGPAFVEYHANPEAAVNVNRLVVERILAAIPKKSVIPILSAAQLGTNGDGKAYLAATDLEAKTVIKLDEAVNPFPNWERILPAPDRGAPIRITLTVENLQALIKAAQAVDPKGNRVTFCIPTELQYQGLDKAKAIAAGCFTQRTSYGEHLEDPKTGREAACRDYPNGEIQSAIRVEISGPEVQITGAVAPIRRVA